MSRVLTNYVSLAYALESTLGVLPGSPSWKYAEPNAITNFGATIGKVVRSPISKKRQLRKEVISDLNSAVEFDADLTRETFRDFIEGFCFASSYGTGSFVPTAAVAGGSGGFTVASGGALAANTLVYSRGFLTAANNGLFVVASGSGATNIKNTTLVNETVGATQNALVSVAGVRGASGDIQVDSSGNIISTVLDFTTLGLQVGQTIWVGGAAAANQFALAANTGFVRLMTIAAHTLTLDKKGQAFATDDGSGKLIDLLFGSFIKNVAVDDAKYVEKSYQFELAYPELGGTGVPEYEYAKGNYCNQIEFTLPLTNKATIKYGFVGTDTELPSTSRKTNASSAKSPVEKLAFSTTSDIARLRLQEHDETGLSTYFKSLTFTIKNNVNPEKTLATLGATFMNAGNFEISIAGEILFTNPLVVNAIKNNDTTMMDFALKNGDGGIFIDVPSMTITGGTKNFTVNESVKIAWTGNAFEDATLGTSIGVSMFPYLP